MRVILANNVVFWIIPLSDVVTELFAPTLFCSVVLALFIKRVECLFRGM
jgi:hypothetical protein